MISIGLCMIVKNEEAVLRRILTPMSKLVDKIYICDTGSVDKTKEIAREFTDEVYDFLWKDDFSAARNFITEKADTDYWMWLDADDVITPENQEKLLRLKESMDSDTDVVMMDYAVGFDEWEHVTFSYYRERIMKTSRKHSFSPYIPSFIHQDQEAFTFHPPIKLCPIAVGMEMSFRHKILLPDLTGIKCRNPHEQATGGTLQNREVTADMINDLFFIHLPICLFILEYPVQITQYTS